MFLANMYCWYSWYNFGLNVEKKSRTVVTFFGNFMT